MGKIMEYLPILIPIIILELSLTIAALIHIFRHNTYRVGNRTIWVIVSFIQIIGPVVYFVYGRGED